MSLALPQEVTGDGGRLADGGDVPRGPLGLVLSDGEGLNHGASARSLEGVVGTAWEAGAAGGEILASCSCTARLCLAASSGLYLGAPLRAFGFGRERPPLLVP